MVAEGFTSIDEIANSTVEELNNIEGFDKELAEELKSRALVFVKNENERVEKTLKNLKIKDDLYNFETLSKSSILKLAENNIKSLDDLADLDSEELYNILGKYVFNSEDEAGEVIMAARQHWFNEEKTD